MHIQEINENAFCLAQHDNKAYTARGDKFIEDQFEITQSLKQLIQKPENDWIKQVIILAQTKEDDVIRNNLSLFKEFLIRHDLSAEDRNPISRSILKSNGDWKEGAISLIETLAINIAAENDKYNTKSPVSHNFMPSIQLEQRKLKVTDSFEKDTKLSNLKDSKELFLKN